MGICIFIVFLGDWLYGNTSMHFGMFFVLLEDKLPKAGHNT
jgi:hypothetical protein